MIFDSTLQPQLLGSGDEDYLRNSAYDNKFMAQSARKLENDGRTENVQNKVKINACVIFKNTTVLRHLYLVMSKALSQVYNLRYWYV